jgi:hypothetical protein
MRSIHLLLGVCLLALATATFAQIPNKISYQGLLTGASDGSYTLKFDLYNLPLSGILRHTETFTGVTVEQGAFSAVLGSTSTLPDIFSGPLYVEITATAGPAGPSYPLTFSPRSELTSAPYSLAPWKSSASGIWYSGGGVGIGASGFSRKLTVIGDVPGDYAVMFANAGIGSGDKGLYVTSQGGDILTLTADNAISRMVVKYDGSVGLGTASPISKLHVTGGALTVDNGDNLSSVVQTNGDLVMRMDRENNDADPSIHFQKGTGPFLMSVRGNGNVGIGTTSPQWKLDVAGGAIVRGGLTLRDPGGDNFIEMYKAGHYGLYLRTDGVFGSWKFRITDVTAGSTFYDLMTITNSGLVGFGTSVPFARLHVETKGASAIEGVGINNSSTGGKMLTMNQGTPGKLNFSNLSGVDLMTLDFTTTRVGIYKTDPAWPLHVWGDIGAEGLMYSYGVPLISDVRYKKDITPIAGALDRVKTMRGVFFNWRTDEYPDRKLSADHQVGFIAQEVEEVFPELVSTMPDGFKSVDYSKVTPLLVEALKEQQKEIDELRTLVQSLLANRSNQSAGESR